MEEDSPRPWTDPLILDAIFKLSWTLSILHRVLIPGLRPCTLSFIFSPYFFSPTATLEPTVVQHTPFVIFSSLFLPPLLALTSTPLIHPIAIVLVTHFTLFWFATHLWICRLSLRLSAPSYFYALLSFSHLFIPCNFLASVHIHTSFLAPCNI